MRAELIGLLFLFLAALSSAMLAIFLRAFQSETDNRYGIILGNYLTCIVLGFILLPDHGAVLHPEKMTLICGMISGFLFILNLVLIQTNIKGNGAILTSAFSRLGLIVPIFISIVGTGERPGPLQWIGIALVFAAMYFINKGTEEASETEAGSVEGTDTTGRKTTAASFAGKNFLLLVILLLVSGITDTMSKVFESVGSRSQDALYVFLVFFFAGILSLILVFTEYKKTGKKVTLKNLLAGIAVGVPNYFSTILLLKSLVKLPAFIAYPGFSTGAILIVSLVSAVLFKEKPGKMRLIGLGIILVALVLLNI